MPFALSTRPVENAGVGGTAVDGLSGGFAASFAAGRPLGISSRELDVSNLLTPLPLPTPALLARELLARLESRLEPPTGLISTPFPLLPTPPVLPTLTPILPATFFTLSLSEEAEDVRASVRPRRSSIPYIAYEVSGVRVGEEERGERGMGIGGVVAPPMEASGSCSSWTCSSWDWWSVDVDDALDIDTYTAEVEILDVEAGVLIPVFSAAESPSR